MTQPYPQVRNWMPGCVLNWWLSCSKMRPAPTQHSTWMQTATPSIPGRPMCRSVCKPWWPASRCCPTICGVEGTIMKRRSFLTHSALGGAAFTTLAHRQALAATTFNEQILVHVFLRGGIDGANLVVPIGDPDHEYYSLMRPTLAIPDSDAGAALPIGAEPFGFNPVLAPLLDLYNAGHLAVV